MNNHPDKRLIALCNEYLSVKMEMDRINYVMSNLSDQDRDRVLVEKETAGVDRVLKLLDIIAKIPAQTREGVTTKATVLLDRYRGTDDESYPLQCDLGGALVLSLARDIIEADASDAAQR